MSVCPHVSSYDCRFRAHGSGKGLGVVGQIDRILFSLSSVLPTLDQQRSSLGMST